ncbi:MAG: CopG family transcriptional regulator [Bacteroidaceae bacterium]|nr:CopG family transcriptional regulator [Bacteroidaceae bacterium]
MLCIVNVSWCDKNFGASLGDNVPGAVVLAAKTFDELQDEVAKTLRFHIGGMLADGDEVPQWLLDGDYEFEYKFIDTSTLLHVYSSDLSLAAISRASGINQTLLSHYANGIKKPRLAQRKRIVDGIHSIGRRLMTATI